MLYLLLLGIVSSSALCTASQQQEKPLSPRTIAKIEEVKKELSENLTKIESAYMHATADQILITSNPRAWLFKKSQEALQACKLQESSQRSEIARHEDLARQKITETAILARLQIQQEQGSFSLET